MKQYFKLYGPINGLVCVGLGLLFLTFNILLIELEDTTIRILFFTPIPLVLIGISLIIWPGNKLTRTKIQDENIHFWSTSPNSNKLMWLLFSAFALCFLTLQFLELFDILSVSLNNCFLSKYFGIGNCM